MMENTNQEKAMELYEEITTKVEDLEERVSVTKEEIKELKNQYQSYKELEELTEEDFKNKSVDELLNIKHIQDDVYEVEVDGKTVQFNRTETKFDKLTTDVTAEEIEEHFKRFDISKDMYVVLDHEQQVELLNYFLEKEALYKEMELMQEEFQNALKEFNEEVMNQNLSKKEDIINMLERKCEIYAKYNRHQAIKDTHKIIDEILYSINLKPIKDAITKIKNPSKVSNNYQTNFLQSEKRFFERLSKNRNYRFIKPENTLQSLMENYAMEENHAKLFLYVFYNHVKTTELVNRYAVCYNDIIKNIIDPECLSDQQQKEFKIAMLEIVGFFTE